MMSCEKLDENVKKDIISFAGEETFSCAGESYIKGTHKIWNKQPYVGRLFCCREIVNFSLDFPGFTVFEENNKKSLTSCAM